MLHMLPRGTCLVCRVAVQGALALHNTLDDLDTAAYDGKVVRGALKDRLTVILTTSPVGSNPSTALLEHTLATFALAPGLQLCRKILVCDGVSVLEAGAKWRNTQFRNGRRIWRPLSSTAAPLPPTTLPPPPPPLQCRPVQATTAVKTLLTPYLCPRGRQQINVTALRRSCYSG
jgi:hypothetical protein